MGWIFFLYPFLELWSLIELGAQTSALTALAWVLGAGVGGVATIRFAGAQALSHLQAAQREGRLQQSLVAQDMVLVVAGFLLVIPGLISDALAVMVLIKPLRILMFGLLPIKPVVSASAQFEQAARRDSASPTSDPRGVTLEGEFQHLDPDRPHIEHRDRDA
jgi:UPF0716 protein FxsA